MTLLWVLFGVVVGGCTEPARQGTISGVIAGILAGVIVLSSLGLILGLLGGQVKTSLVGGLLGGGLVFLLGFFGTKVNPFLLGSFGLILGGLAGGTIGILFWWIRCVKHLVMRATQGRRPSGQANQPWFSSLGRERPPRNSSPGLTLRNRQWTQKSCRRWLSSDHTCAASCKESCG